VEQSGGTLTVDSGEGQGTTFVIVLPRYDLDDYLL
jgi:signal transduction histidine kinase